MPDGIILSLTANVCRPLTGPSHVLSDGDGSAPETDGAGHGEAHAGGAAHSDGAGHAGGDESAGPSGPAEAGGPDASESFESSSADKMEL